MRSQAIVMAPDAFEKWLRQQEKGAAPAPAPTTTSSSGSSGSASAAGLNAFNAKECASCHTLTAANATGTIGPDLDKLVSYAKQAHQPLTAFVHESIVDPGKYVQPGYPNGVMPENFGQTLTKSQLDALVTFLVQSAQQAKKG
jgi:mono/diheme cytochrome c family protein